MLLPHSQGVSRPADLQTFAFHLPPVRWRLCPHAIPGNYLYLKFKKRLLQPVLYRLRSALHITLLEL